MNPVRRLSDALRGMRLAQVVLELAPLILGILACRALRSGVAPADREVVAGALTRLTSRRTLRLTRATYTDLLSTGNLRLVRNAALRDRIVGLYETNERTLVIRDRNNEVFVDQMYMQYLLGSGLIAPRPGHNLPQLLMPMREFDERVAVPVDARSDRLWRLPEDDPERFVLANKVWFRSYLSQTAIAQTRTMIEEIRSVRDEITAELARRRPRQS